MQFLNTKILYISTRDKKIKGDLKMSINTTISNVIVFLEKCFAQNKTTAYNGEVIVLDFDAKFELPEISAELPELEIELPEICCELPEITMAIAA